MYWLKVPRPNAGPNPVRTQVPVSPEGPGLISLAKSTDIGLMIYDDLVNKPYNELELVELVAQRFHAAFREQCANFHYLKLARVDDKRSKIFWVKIFDNGDDYLDFHYSFEFYQTKISVLPRGSCYSASLFGYISDTSIYIYEDKIKPSRWITEAVEGMESSRTTPRHIVEAGFADLTTQFRDKAKKVS